MDQYLEFVGNHTILTLGLLATGAGVTAVEIDSKLSQFDKSKPIIAVCDAGISSNRAVDKLRKAGFEMAFGLKGGMNAWNQDGLPVVTGKKTRSKGRKKDGKKS